MNGFITALNTVLGTTTEMIQSIGGKGVVITLAMLTVAVVIIFIRIGWRKGLNAMEGKISSADWEKYGGDIDYFDGAYHDQMGGKFKTRYQALQSAKNIDQLGL